MYCKKCGGKIESYASHCPFCGEAIANNSVEATYTSSIQAQRGSTRTVGSWILTYIITCIPLIGLIMLFIWAFGDKTKEDLTFRNWAKAQLLIMIIAVLLSIIATISMLPLLMEILNELATTPIQ